MTRKSLPFGFTSSTSERPATINYWLGHPPELEEIQVGTPAWFEWLAQGDSFKVTYWGQAGSVVFFVQSEQRKNSQNLYWQAWKTIGGKTRKKYLGPSSKVTKAKLDEVGEYFLEQLHQAHEDETDIPAGWQDLSVEQKYEVERYILTLLVKQKEK